MTKNCLILLSQIEFSLNFHSCNLNGMEFWSSRELLHIVLCITPKILNLLAQKFHVIKETQCAAVVSNVHMLRNTEHYLPKSIISSHPTKQYYYTWIRVEDFQLGRKTPILILLHQQDCNIIQLLIWKLQKPTSVASLSTLNI